MEHMQEVLVGPASVVRIDQREFRCPSTRMGLRPRETGGSAQTGASLGGVCDCVSHTIIDRTQDRAESVGYFTNLIVPFLF